jgi:hypothetical protein
MLPPLVEVRTVDGYGFGCKGLFATMDLPENTAVWTWDDKTEPLVTYSAAEIHMHPHGERLRNWSYMVGDDAFATTDMDQNHPNFDPSWYFNHSCDPNCWFLGDGCIVTLRPVAKDEQLCYDYAVTETEASFHKGIQCRCGAKMCRGVLTFEEWKDSAFVEKNANHVTDYILSKHRAWIVSTRGETGNCI